jgi:hypothetical protein
MAEQKEIFRTLDNGSEDGIAIDKRTQGSAVSGANSHMVLPAEDASNNLDLLQIQNDGSTAPSKAQAQMPAKDQAGNIQYIPIVNGAVAVTSEGAGIIRKDMIQGVVSSPGSYEQTAFLTLSLNKVYTNLEVNCSSFKDCAWKLEYVDDSGGGGETTTTIWPGEFRTGAGDYTFKELFEHFELDTSGGTGVQELILSIEQRSGSGSDYNAALAVLEN